jgi:uncharacterized RDD family membrane protein YckC
MPETPSASSTWPGRGLGLPPSGPGSIARIGRRLGALAIDWALSVIISNAFFNYDPLATLGIFVVAQIIFTVTTGASIGHRLVGLRLMNSDGQPLGIWRPVVRALLIAIVIPAVIWDKDQRGMHDRLIGTALVRR